jgi:hypothetical protein
MIDYTQLLEGDIYIYETGIFNKSDICGFVVRPYSGKLFYGAEINSDGKLKFVNLEKTHFHTIRRKIGLFNSSADRQRFRNDIIRIHEDLIVNNICYMGNSTDFVCSQLFIQTEDEDFRTNPSIDFIMYNYKLVTMIED